MVGRFFTDIGEKFAGPSEKPTDIGKKRSREIPSKFLCFFFIRSNLD
jgi:hypothetical protein